MRYRWACQCPTGCPRYVCKQDFNETIETTSVCRPEPLTTDRRRPTTFSIAKKSPSPKTVATLTHDADKRKNIPSAEQQSIILKEIEQPKKVRYPRNTDLDPQLVWRGKDGKADHITREPEQVKAFLDTWRNGIHNYLT